MLVHSSAFFVDTGPLAAADLRRHRRSPLEHDSTLFALYGPDR